MAAGEGTRAFPYNLMTEKSLLRIGGKPIISHIVDNIITSMLWKIPDKTLDDQSFVFCILKKHAADFKHEFRDMPIARFHAVDKPLGTAGHYLQAAKDFGIRDDEDILLHYADSMTNIDYARMYEEYQQKQSDCMIAITNIKSEYSEVHEVNDELFGFTEKPAMNFPSWTGIAMFKHGLIELAVKNDQKFIIMTDNDLSALNHKPDFGHDIFPAILRIRNDEYWKSKSKKPYTIKFNSYFHHGYYYDVGNAHNYNKLVEEYLKSGKIT